MGFQVSLFVFCAAGELIRFGEKVSAVASYRFIFKFCCLFLRLTFFFVCFLWSLLLSYLFFGARLLACLSTRTAFLEIVCLSATSYVSETAA